MSKEKVLFIYNAHSGKGVIKQNLSDIMDIFVKADFDITVYPTQSSGDATKKVIDSASEYDRIVCSGGDGTLNEVTKGLMQTAEREGLCLGYIPAGSTNDFGNSLGIAGDMISAAQIAAGHCARRIDIGNFNEDYFVYVAAFGIFTEVAYQTDQSLKNFLGHAAYIFEAIKTLQDIPVIPLQVEADGRIIRGEFIFGMVTNAMQVGGIKDFIKGDVELSDGLFEVMLIKSPKNPIELAEIGSFLTNIKKETNMVYSFQARSLKFTSSIPVSWTLDGEFGGSETVANITNKARSINVLVRDNE